MVLNNAGMNCLLLVCIHCFLWLRQVELLRETLLSLHWLREAATVVDDLGFGGRHYDDDWLFGNLDVF